MKLLLRRDQKSGIPAGNPDFIVQATSTTTSTTTTTTSTTTTTQANQSPHATSGTQYRTDTSAAIGSGGTIAQGVGVSFGATVTDPDVSDTIKIEVELHPLPATFNGVANYSSGYVSSGQQARTATIAGLAPGS